MPFQSESKKYIDGEVLLSLRAGIKAVYTLALAVYEF
jgi:hypothetical protein